MKMLPCSGQKQRILKWRDKKDIAIINSLHSESKDLINPRG